MCINDKKGQEITNKGWIIVLYCLFLSFTAQAQTSAGNLGMFDHRTLHYGIQVGYTQSKFDLAYSENDTLRQTLQGVTSYYAPGFHIAVIGDLRLGNWFNLRLLPGVTIVTRTLGYSWENGYLATHRLAERSRNASQEDSMPRMVTFFPLCSFILFVMILFYRLLFHTLRLCAP